MRKHRSTILLVLVFFIGLCVMLYPTISDYWNSRVQSKAISNYESLFQTMDTTDYSAYFKPAEDYNLKLQRVSYPLINYKEIPGYDSILNPSDTGMIGYISIQKINVELPIYHGTSDAVLNTSAGHLKGSSFPIGGTSTHAVLSAHRGLPSARLFTDLNKLELGDVFTITVLDRVLTYQVDQILVVTPDDVSALRIEAGKDYCTLLTCTPYGINSHRLLVRGTRIETLKEKPKIYVTNDAYRIDPMIVTPAVAAPMLLILLIMLLIKYSRRK